MGKNEIKQSNKYPKYFLWDKGNIVEPSDGLAKDLFYIVIRKFIEENRELTLRDLQRIFGERVLAEEEVNEKSENSKEGEKSKKRYSHTLTIQNGETVYIYSNSGKGAGLGNTPNFIDFIGKLGFVCTRKVVNGVEEYRVEYKK